MRRSQGQEKYGTVKKTVSLSLMKHKWGENLTNSNETNRVLLPEKPMLSIDTWITRDVYSLDLCASWL